jgi:hypothetical protein
MSDPCLCPPIAYACGAGLTPCPLGTACVATGCGTSAYCLPAGTGCESDRDCAAGARCSLVYGRLACARAEPGCTDSRDCPLGHACEPDGAGGRACVDRRIPCDFTVGCPRGFFCRVEEGLTPFCEYTYRRCDRNGACWGLSCSDLDGDGARECGFPSGACPDPACPAGTVCGLAVLDYNLECGSHGPCRSAADCSSGHECVDLWGDGVRTCEPSGASCGAGTCPARQICATPIEGGAPRCISG